MANSSPSAEDESLATRSPRRGPHHHVPHEQRVPHELSRVSKGRPACLSAMIESLIKEINYRVKGDRKFWNRPDGAKPSCRSAPPSSTITTASPTGSSTTRLLTLPPLDPANRPPPKFNSPYAPLTLALRGRPLPASAPWHHPADAGSGRPHWLSCCQRIFCLEGNGVTRHVLILLTNDDGIYAPGLQALESRAATAGRRGRRRAGDRAERRRPLDHVPHAAGCQAGLRRRAPPRLGRRRQPGRLA